MSPDVSFRKPVGTIRYRRRGSYLDNVRYVVTVVHKGVRLRFPAATSDLSASGIPTSAPKDFEGGILWSQTSNSTTTTITKYHVSF